MKSHLWRVIFLLAGALLLLGCGPNERELTTRVETSIEATIAAMPTHTLYPTYTPLPTLTPYPTATVLPPTPTPALTGVGEWMEGHYWSIKVIEVQTNTELEGSYPANDVYVLVNVQWKANNLSERHSIDGNDFELVDAAGVQYDIAGMIYEDETLEPFTPNARYQKGKWVTTRARGNTDDVMRLVFDLPSPVTGLRLWFQDFPLIDLGLD